MKHSCPFGAQRRIKTPPPSPPPLRGRDREGVFR